MEGKIYDLEDRTLEFAKRVLRMTRILSKNNVNSHYVSQIIRSSSSVGANYGEANDALGKKDFFHRMKISRKEAKETTFWLKLIIENNPELEMRIKPLLQESVELTKIFSSKTIKLMIRVLATGERNHPKYIINPLIRKKKKIILKYLIYQTIPLMNNIKNIRKPHQKQC